MMGRVWIVALAVIVARYAGGKDDGIMAAVARAGRVHGVLRDVVRHAGETLQPAAQGSPQPS